MTQTTMCPIAHGFDPLGEDYLAEPYAQLNDLRVDGPVHYAPSIDYWVVTRYADIAKILADPETFSATIAQAPLVPLTEEVKEILTSGVRNTPVLSNLDPPHHTRVRLHLATMFTPRRVQAMSDRIEALASELVEQFASRGRADLITELTFPLPALTMFRLLGFPDEDSEELKSWCNDKLEVNWGRPDAQYQRRAATNMSKFWDYCERFVALRKNNLSDDLTSDLLRQRENDSEALDDQEIASVIFALSFAGHETTTNLMGNALRQLLSRPELWKELCEEPRLIPGAVEETLRFDSSVIAWRRLTTRDVAIDGVAVPAGSKLMLAFGAANHDPSMFPEPERFDIRRDNARLQLSFGKGTHFCLGQHLARVEARIVIGMLTQRFPNMRLVEDQHLTFSANISFRGPEKLLVEWEES
ncbi:cytochrome P450 [Arthrobacter pascens]|uniref:cytochrome P450 n=1 Tax=Arthrobacter pascens TaxID=1677 RepID=UPI0027862C13|nr:cytochrome P450 [Arthrobacter pascens]MDQ0634343.1 cytochrome P450 [Arthrobacter pascens]